MARKPAAPMPDEVRHLLRAQAHPARAVACPHCEARENRPCTTKSKRHLITDAPVHPARIAAWATATACCPTCQVTPGTPCHHDGTPLHGDDVHPARHTEAKETAMPTARDIIWPAR